METERGQANRHGHQNIGEVGFIGFRCGEIAQDRVVNLEEKRSKYHDKGDDLDTKK